MERPWQTAVQPVFIAADGATPPTGEDFYPMLARANEIWAKCCLQFRAKCPIYVDEQDYRVSTTAEATAFKDTANVNDAIEVFVSNACCGFVWKYLRAPGEGESNVGSWIFTQGRVSIEDRPRGIAILPQRTTEAEPRRRLLTEGWMALMEHRVVLSDDGRIGEGRAGLARGLFGAVSPILVFTAWPLVEPDHGRRDRNVPAIEKA